MADQRSRPAMPRELKGEARAEWRRVVAYLEDVDQVALVDRSILLRYCTAYGEWCEFNEMLERTGRVIAGRGGGLVRNPVWLLRRDTEQTLQDLMRELAITPAARQRFGMNQEPAPPAVDASVSKLDELRARRAKMQGGS